MLKEVTIATNNLDPSTWTKHNVEDVLALIKETFPEVFPDTARIYHLSVCQTNDVTPGAETIEQDIAKIQSLPGPFFVVVFPEAAALPYIVAIVLAVASYVLAPGVPKIAALPPLALARNQQAASPNNELSDRSNRARINGRIADIYGTVRSVPDLIAAPYKIFENNREIEFAYMCIGRGEYNIADIRDGATLVDRIPGTSVMIYAPYTSPNQYDPTVPGSATPQLTVGELRHVPVLSTRRSNSVNGQVLRPPNAVTWSYASSPTDGQVRFVFPNIIENTGGLHDFTKFFVEGDVIDVVGAVMDGSPITSNIEFQAFKGNLVYTYPGGTKTFDCGNGALLFPAYYYGILASIFPNAGTVVLSTESVTSIGNLSGTYTVAGTPAVFGPTDTAQQSAGIPSFFIVKLVNAATVNPNWDSLPTLTTFHSNFTYVSSPFNIDLDGEYTVTSVTQTILTVDNPNSVSTDWTTVLATELATPLLNVTMVSAGLKWVGPFILEDPLLTEVYSNFVASNGLYKDSGDPDLGQTAAEVFVEIELTPVDSLDAPLSDSETFQIGLKGSSFLKETVATTLKARPTFQGRCQVRARRITEADEEFEGQVVDEVRWRDVYSVAPVTKTDFGNVTTVFSITLATASALAVKERKLNMLVQRRIPTFVDGVFTNTLAGTNDAALIFAAMCRDKYIGNRKLQELDVQNFFDTADDVEAYFGTPRVREFNYTFDKEDLSFEEMADAIAKVMFCVAYRRGSVIRLSFERETTDSTLLFNHRNKIPGTEKRAISFGGASENDGIEYTYVDPRDDSINTIFLPEVAAINPKKIESIGVRDHLAAYFHAWRIWNRMLFQNTTVEFDATQEADLLITNDRILVSDGTRPYIQEGEVDEIVGTELTLSQLVNVTDDPPYTIFLQHFDASVEAIEVTAGSAANKVVLDSAPAMDLVTAKNMYAKTTYLLVGANDVTQKAFLVTEKSAPENMVSTVTAVNYNAGYYANDLDFINHIITEDGYGETGGFIPPDLGDDGYRPPEIPPVLTFIFNSLTSVTLNWTAPSGFELPVTEYRLMRSPLNAGTFTQIFSDDSDLTYDDTGTTIEYNYRVDAYIDGLAHSSNVIAVGLDAFLVLWMKFNGDFSDSSDSGIAFTADNSPTINTSVQKFGSGCLSVNNSYLRTLYANDGPLDINENGEDFTIEWWQRFTSPVSYVNCPWSFAAEDFSNFFRAYISGDGGMNIQAAGVLSATPPAAWGDVFQPVAGGHLIPNTWYHFAISRHNDQGILFIDGVTTVTPGAGWTGNNTFGTTFAIGKTANSSGSSGFDWEGFIDNLKIYKGVAKYQANFTPPATEND